MSANLFFSNVSEPVRFRQAIQRFDTLNAADPNLETIEGVTHPRELLHAQRLCDWVMQLSPGASEPLRLAARSQHLCRWQIPRASYDLTRAGYHRWRTALKQFHAEQSAAVLRAAGYGDDVIARVSDLNLKKHLPADPETQVLEDALCLVFLQFQLADLAARTDEVKVINALQKSWAKMSPAGHEQALRLEYAPREQALLQQALRPAS